MAAVKSRWIEGVARRRNLISKATVVFARALLFAASVLSGRFLKHISNFNGRQKFF